MLESALIFVKDWEEILKLEREFYKNHWKGVLILNGAIIVGSLGGIKLTYYIDKKRNNRKNKKKKILSWT